ncbi:MAG: phosphoglucosamine mutase [Candidatus Wallbacteria bacterium]
MNFFGTDGIRGIANNHPLTPEFVMRVAVAAASVLAGDKRSKKDNSEMPFVIIGADTRISSNMLAYAAGAGLMSMGFDVLNLDVIPTAGLSWLTKKLGAAFGIMISASHNPYFDNGVKIFSSDGHKLDESVEAKIEEELFKEASARPTHNKIGKLKKVNSYIIDPVTEYCEFVSGLIEKSQPGAKKLKVVIDGSNGASSALVKKIFADRFALIQINCSPDGENINFNCGSTHLDGLAQRVIKEHANLGIAFDGDSDRALFVDEHGNVIDGDHIIAMLAIDMKNSGTLKNNLVVSTVMCNLGFIHAMKRENINLITTAVGDRNVLGEMLAGGGIIGGEQSGHIILYDRNHTGDGLITAVSVLNLMKKTGKKLSELAKVINKYPQVLINVRVKADKNIYMQNAEISKIIKDTEKCFENRGRLLVRPSGTENLIRVMLEGEDKKEITDSAEKIAEIIKNNMG